MNYYIIGGIVVVAVGFLLIRRRRKAAAAAKAKKKVKQIPVHGIVPRTPGKGTPLFHGVRVVELATVIAGPTAGRTLAELGAEVFKVEEPGKGDPWRYWFLQYEKGRPFGTSWESANLNKSSVCIDLKHEAGVQQLKKLLQQADVFLTNVRSDALNRIGMSYHQLAEEFPHLIYAHLTAYGRHGEGSLLPGYDIGAFWANTGMGAMIHSEGRYSSYPVAFGDLSTGYNLAGGIALALRARLRTGRGSLVSNGLLRAGYWAMAPYLVHEKPGRADEVPDYDNEKYRHRFLAPLIQTYGTNDDGWISLSQTPDGLLENVGAATEAKERTAVAQAVGRLVKALVVATGGSGTDGDMDAAEKAAAAGDGPTACQHLASLYKRCTLEQAERATDLAKVKYVSVRTFRNVVQTDFKQDPLTANANCHVPVPGLTDLPHFVSVPFDLDCSVEHGPNRRGPLLGEHTAHVLEHGFSPIAPGAEIKRVGRGTAAATGDVDPAELLDGVVVVELSGYGQCPAAVAAQLSDYGATVYKVEPAPNGDPWRRRDPALFAQLNRGKQSVSLDLTSVAGKSTMELLLGRANVFITNWTESRLAEVGLGVDAVRGRHPELVYTLVTPWGQGGPDEECADHGPYWAYSGLASYMSGKDAPTFTHQPRMCGDLQASLLCFPGVASALFHQRRTGEGQLVNFNLVRAGQIGLSQIYSILVLDKAKQALFDLPAKFKRHHFPIPTANCYQTKDGRWVQMLGTALPVWLPKFIKEFGLYSIYLKLVWCGLSKVLRNRDPNLFKKLFPVFVLLNTEFEKFIGSLTYAEFQKLCGDKIWYTPINMPTQARDYKYAHENGVFRVCPDSGHTFVTTPLHVNHKTGFKLLSDLHAKGVPVKVPALNENDLQ